MFQGEWITKRERPIAPYPESNRHRLFVALFTQLDKAMSNGDAGSIVIREDCGRENRWNFVKRNGWLVKQ